MKASIPEYIFIIVYICSIASFPHLIVIKMNVHVLLLVVLYNARIIHSTVQSKGMAYSWILFRKSLKIQKG